MRGQFIYPEDAEEHFGHIHAVFHEMFAAEQAHEYAGYSGPWIENVWISKMWAEVLATRADGKPLKATFGVHIPLLFPWVDLWVNANPEPYQYPREFKTLLRSVLRRNVLYVTVSQNDLGILGRQGSDFMQSELRNILVFSSGGYGHIPIPLLKDSVQSCMSRDVRSRGLFMSFSGTVGTAPHHLRERMRAAITRHGNEQGVPIFDGSSRHWQNISCNSRFVLCPRGYGRTSYRLSETVQLGRVPIFIYSDLLWLPYRDHLSEIIYVTNIDHLNTLLESLHHVTDEELTRREELLLNLAETHFSYDGVINQILLYLLGGETSSDLRRQSLPTSANDE